jgi:dihydrofolate synthase/folylpolyglutamate synthase
VLRLLDRLGRPHEHLPPVVHVAGTNGKGSVIAYLRAFLEAAGKRVHVYTSPHLVRFNERIRLAGRPIDDAGLVALLEECEAANGAEPITFFEITTAAAFLAFARQPADAVLLETGLGGRLDATNVVAVPALTAITPVSLDHQHYLGTTLAAIAGEKAGILKAGVPAVVARQERAARRIIEERAREVGAPLIEEGKDWFVRRREGEGLFYQGRRAGLSGLPAPALAGAHQIRNAGQAIACAEALGERVPALAVPAAAIGLGLKTVEWPGRLQRLTRGPLAALLPPGWELWLDGGHNPDAAEALAAHARHWKDRPLHLIWGMLNTKDAAGFLKPLAARVRLLRTVAVPGEPNALSAGELAAIGESLLMQVVPAEDVTAALADILDHETRPSRVLICGSLYLAGTVLRHNG